MGPDLSTYLDYRAFLRDLLAERQRLQPLFSLRLFAKRIGIDPSNLLKVLQGARHLPEDVIPELAAFCRWESRERKLFEALWRFGKVRKATEAQAMLERVEELRGPRIRTLASDRQEFYRSWRHTAVFSLVDVMPDADAETLGARLIPRCDPAEVQESLDLLVRLAMLKREAGRWVHADRLVSTGRKWRARAIARFQEETLDLARRSLRETPPDRRDISTLTVTAAAKDIEAIREMTRTFRREVLRLVQDSREPATAVWQINLQVFPLSEEVAR